MVEAVARAGGRTGGREKEGLIDYHFLRHNVKGEASARWTLIQQQGFSPSPPPTCCAFVGWVIAPDAEVPKGMDNKIDLAVRAALSTDSRC